MMKLIYLSKENFVRDSGYDNELTYQLKWCYVYFSDDFISDDIL